MRARSGSWSRRLVGFVLALAVGALVLPATSHVRAASLLERFAEPDSTGLLARVARQPIEERDFPLPGTRGRLYLPVGIKRPPGIVVVHGVHYKGIDEPRLVRFARSTAAAGVAVMTPEIRELCDYRIEPASVDTIGASVRAFSERFVGRPVGVVGFSFAGGLALIAAADPVYQGAFAFVVAVGAHDDMSRVLHFLLSSESTRPDGSKLRLRAHDYGTVVFVYSHASDFFSPADLPTARDVLRLWLHEDFDAAHARSPALSSDGAAKMKRVFSRDTALLGPELEAEVNRLKPDFAAVSPSAHLAALRVPVLLLHGQDDSVIPSSETEWLAHDTPSGMLRAVLVTPLLEHVELQGEKKIGEELALVHFMSEVLDAADDERAR